MRSFFNAIGKKSLTSRHINNLFVLYFKKNISGSFCKKISYLFFKFFTTNLYIYTDNIKSITTNYALHLDYSDNQIKFIEN